MFSVNGEANEDFQAWAEDYVLFLHVTSRVYTDAHHDLFSERGGFGFPYLAFLDETGNVLAQHAGPRTLDGLDATAATAWDRNALRSKAAAGDGDAKVALFVQRMRMEALSLDEARAGLAQVSGKLTADQRAEVEQAMVNREIGDALARLQREHGNDLREALPAAAAALFQAGKVPNNRLASYYFDAVFSHARTTGDRGLAEKVVATAESALKDARGGSRLVQNLRRRLESW